MLKLVRRCDSNAREDDVVKTGSTLVVSANEIVSLTVAKLDLSNRVVSGGELRTDSSIAKEAAGQLAGRELQTASAWCVVLTFTLLHFTVFARG